MQNKLKYYLLLSRHLRHRLRQPFKKACSLLLILSFISYSLPLSTFASESTNYCLSTFAITSTGEPLTGVSYDLKNNTFGEAVNGDLESTNIKAKSGFLHAVSRNNLPPPIPAAANPAESANFIQAAYCMSSADTKAFSANFAVPLACLGEPIAGVFESYYDVSCAGYLYALGTNAPILTQNIPNQIWQVNTANDNAFNLNDYFTHPDASTLTFIVSGNTNINVNINPATGEVSFSQNNGFTGTEDIIITAIDAHNNKTSSNPITLNVYNFGGMIPINNAPVLDYIPDITTKEGELVKITAGATDPDNNPLTYTFSAPFDSEGKWQTDYQSAGIYNITVTAGDGALSDTQNVKVTVLNVNRKPTLNYIADISGAENQLITITPTAADPDNDALIFLFSAPFNESGQWLPTYRDAGVRMVTVTVSDGSLTDSQQVLVNISNVNTTPTVSISLSAINVEVDKEFSFQVNAADADYDPLTLILKKDGAEFYTGGIYQFHIAVTSFSTLGIHTITAIVKDNHGAQAEQTVNVEVIDPKDLIGKVLPLLGDFNGDGIADIGTYNNETGEWSVALSDLTGFGSLNVWLTNFGNSTDWRYVNGDFNGDSKTDIAIFNHKSGEWQVALSNGAGFENKGNWTVLWNPTANEIPITGDFNSDGISDVGVYNKATGQVRIALSYKSGFWQAAPWIDLAYSDKADPFTGDFNADGITDIGVYNSGAWTFSAGTGNGFVPMPLWSVSFGDADKTPVISDFNNDGLTDIGIFTKDTGRWEIYRCTGNGFIPAGDWLTNFGQGEQNTVYALDFNGDGLTDAAAYNYASFTWQRRAAGGTVCDLLKKITNGLGGTTEIIYKPSVYYDNTGGDGICDLPFSIQTVNKTIQGDGMGNFYETNYTYANGLYDPAERESRGFGYVKVTDVEGNISENWFKQDNIFKGLPYQSQTKDAAGNIYVKTDNTYNYTEPYAPYAGTTFAYLTESTVYNYDKEMTPRTTRTTYEYDNYGNPTRVVGLGDINVTGDERETLTEYVYNTGPCILGLPAHVLLKDENGNTVSEQWFYYDGHTNCYEDPIKGELTKQETWLNTTGNRISAEYGYDEYGNVLTTTDARGNTTTYTYDLVMHTYPVSVTNSLGHTVTSAYHLGTGQVLNATDANGQTSRNEYDLFQRPVRSFGPNDNATHPASWYEYDYSTTPAKITTYVREETNTDNPDKIRTSYSFIDGLGRTIQTKTEADDPNQQIVSGTVKFNSRGEVEHKYFPYFTAKTDTYTIPSYTQEKATYEYDAVGRLTRQTNPDGTFSTVQYKPGKITTTDANNHKISKYTNAYGQIIKIQEFNQGSIYTTLYEYDTLGNLTKTTDNQNNIISINYDTLGRKTLMDDPDMGIWSYVYDKNGNLISQTDAKNQTIYFDYDALNRLTKKHTTAEILTEYIYDDETKDFCIGRLSKVMDQSGGTEFFYDNLGREIQTIKTVNSTPYTVSRTYDALSRLNTVTYPDGEIVTYTYSASGGIKTVVGNTTYIADATYTATGQMSRAQYGNNTHMDYEYDPQTLRLTHLTTNDGALQNLQYQFDNVGNITGITDNVHTASQSFAYDDLDRMTLAIGQSYGTRNYQYDSIGNIIHKAGVNYTYEENGAGPHALTSGDNGLSIAYDDNGNMLTKDDKNFAYNIENRLTRVQGTTSSAPISIDLTLSHGWNYFSLPVIPDDNQITAIFNELTFGTDYDQISRYNPAEGDFDNFNNTAYNQFETIEYGRGYLVYAPGENDITLTITGTLPDTPQQLSLKNGWNLIGTPSNSSITAAEALSALISGTDYDRIVKYNSVTETYEDLAETATLDPGQAYYLHCLKDVTWNLPTAQDTTEFVYDGDGGRTIKRVNSSQFTIYLGSLYEEDSDGTSRKHIFLGANRICSVTQDSIHNTQYAYYHPDHLGSSNIITNGTGEEVQYLEYLPYGKTNLSTGTDSTNYKFTGKELDVSTGLYFYGARYYDPEIARFITPDPTIQHPYDPQDLNRYSYCRNNPLNLVDPSGLGWFKKAFKKVTKAVKKVWKEIKDPVITFTSTLILSGGNVVAAAAATITTVLLDTGEGKQLTKRVGKEVFDDVFGMRHGSAYVWSRITLQIAGTLMFENIIKSAIANPASASQYDSKNPSHKTMTDNPNGYDASGGRIPGGENLPKYRGFDLTNPDVKMLALTVKGQSNPVAVLGTGSFGPNMLHTGAVSSSFPGSGIERLAFGHDFLNGYATAFGVCHQASNATLLASGISSTVWDIAPHWSTFASTIMYGNYGGQLTNYIYTGVRTDTGYEKN
ncbi:MAG: RHS repeat-associated core domain-containing protein [Candidatus Omnitrophota bacterium]